MGGGVDAAGSVIRPAISRPQRSEGDVGLYAVARALLASQVRLDFRVRIGPRALCPLPSLEMARFNPGRFRDDEERLLLCLHSGQHL
jgi:hypothetical protein